MLTFLFSVILGSSYCSGFVDTTGRWNSGFYCPETEEAAVKVKNIWFIQ